MVTEPLSKTDARQCDKHISAQTKKVAAQLDNLYQMLETVAPAQIHTALDYASWRAYVKDTFRFLPDEWRPDYLAAMIAKATEPKKEE